MIFDLQKAGLWKRISAWLFDGILTGTLAIGICLVLSAAFGYNQHNAAMETTMSLYEAEYGVVFDITQEAYLSLTEAERQNYDDAYAALIADQDFLYAYNLTLNLSLVIASLGILVAVLLWEFVIPLLLGNGQTLGKKIFGLCLIRNDGVKVNNLQMFTRTILGKYTIEIMIPIYVLMLIFWGSIGLFGTLVLLALTLAQAICLMKTKTNSAIHDLLAGTVVVDYSSQMIFRTTEDLIAYKKKVAAEQSARQAY